jgi:hypothetical protein
MEIAYSLIHRVNISANSVGYRQNLDDQLVCPECYEQVFKKEMWVPSQLTKTHFFSHYAGKFDGCSLRTPNENNELNKSDSLARLQRLSEFNQKFRDEILNGFRKIVGKSKSNSMNDTFEFAKRIAIEKLKSGEISRLSKILITSLADPITSTIDESLENLEEAICPIYWHLTTPYGENNLYFVTTITLLLAYHEESTYLEKLLDKKFIKSTSNLEKVLLGNSVLLLAHYIKWEKSLKSVNNYLANLDKDIKPHNERLLNRNILNAKLKRDNSKQEHIQYCSVCKNPFISKGDKICSSCAWKSRAIKPTEYVHHFEKKSWLSSQPWDENNIQQHKTKPTSVTTLNKSKESDNLIKKPATETNPRRVLWIKTERGLRNKETGELILFVDTLRSVFPVAGYSVNRSSIAFIADSEIEQNNKNF